MLIFRRIRKLLSEYEYFPRFAEASRQTRFEQRVRSLALNFWGDKISRIDFELGMRDLLRGELQNAWERGFDDMGIEASEIEAEERGAVESMILHQTDYIGRYAEWIYRNRNSKKNTILSRAALWSKLYSDFRTQARIMAGENQKLEWIYSDAVGVHCHTCLSLHGKVKRAKYWRASGLHPQDPPNPKLDCKGWRCLCILAPTDKPISPGKLPGEQNASER